MNHEKSGTATLMSRASHFELMRIFSAKHGRSRARVGRCGIAAAEKKKSLLFLFEQREKRRSRCTIAEKCAGAEEANRVGGSADKPVGWCGARVCG